MNVEAELKKDGIEIVGRLDTLSVNSLAKNVSEKICKAFPRARFNSQQLFIDLARIPMYIAKMPEGFAEANYFYKNTSIYFKQGIPLEELEKFAIHEFIHYLQEVKDEKGNLYRLGLCEYGEFKVYGMALNEGAVQLATAKALKNEEEIVKYYDISFPTTSPNCYPLLCNLVRQLAYLVGENNLWNSTFFSTDTFKLEAIKLCGRKQFLKVQDNLDKILNTEEKIITLNQTLLKDDCEDAKAKKISNKIESLKLYLKNIFLETQELMFSSYFDKEFEKLTTTQSIELYRTKLYNYKNYIGITDHYLTFNDYYLTKMELLETRHEAILNNVALVPVSHSRFAHLFEAIKKLFSFSAHSEKHENE